MYKLITNTNAFIFLTRTPLTLPSPRRGEGQGEGWLAPYQSRGKLIKPGMTKTRETS